MAKEAVKEVVYFRLYIVSGAPNSVRAIINLQQICDRYVQQPYEIEVVDLLVNARRALDDDILVTPTLLKVAPSPQIRIVGDLSQLQNVVAALGLDRSSHE